MARPRTRKKIKKTSRTSSLGQGSDFNTPRLQLVIMAVGDAIRHAREKLDRIPEDQQPDQEDYLMRLGNLQADLRSEYERRDKRGERLTPYDLLVGNASFRKL